MRIMFLTRSLAVGGAERQLVGLARGLQQAGHRVAVASLYDDIPLGQELGGTGVEVHVTGKRSRWDVTGFARRLLTLVRVWKPDIIHSYLPVPNIISALMSPLLRVPIVWGVRSSDVDLSRFDWLTRLTYRIEPYLSWVPALIIVNSRAGYEHAVAHGYRSDRIVVIPNGVDVDHLRFDEQGRQRLRSEWQVSEDTALVGIVARLDPLKDHRTFLDAAATVCGMRDDVKFVVVGSGPAEELDKLKAHARATGVESRVLFAGSRSDIGSVYSALDILCSSSSTEGFPNVLAEAMSCGTPCVATDAGDSAEIVGKVGVVVPKRDPAALAAAIFAVIEDRPFSRDACRERMESNFSLDALVRRTVAAIEAKVRPR